MRSISAIILTKNEEKNIRDCINSIKGFCERIIVVDSGSTDNTVKIAEELGADIYYNPFVNYAKQFNWGIDNTNIETNWILRLDADERFTPKLIQKLETSLDLYAESEINGIVLHAWLYFMGKRLKFGNSSKKRKLMIFKKGIGRIEEREMDEHTILTEGKSIFVKERFIHFDFKNIDHFISKLNWYATRETKDYFNFKNKRTSNTLADEKINKKRRKKERYYKLPLFFRSLLLFSYIYFVRLGFLDGKEGYLYCYYYSYFYRTTVDAKIYEITKSNGGVVD